MKFLNPFFLSSNDSLLPLRVYFISSVHQASRRSMHPSSSNRSPFRFPDFSRPRDSSTGDGKVVIGRPPRRTRGRRARRDHRSHACNSARGRTVRDICPGSGNTTAATWPPFSIPGWSGAPCARPASCTRSRPSSSRWSACRSCANRVLESVSFRPLDRHTTHHNLSARADALGHSRGPNEASPVCSLHIAASPPRTRPQCCWG